MDLSALLEGNALTERNRAYINGGSWKVLADKKAWSEETEGKTVEGLGTVRKSMAGEFSLEKATTRLVNLEDQLDREVELRGVIKSNNSVWWLEYHEAKLYVEDLEKLQKKLSHAHWATVSVRGHLESAELPDLDRSGSKRKYYFVRKATISTIDSLLAPELSRKAPLLR